MKTALLILSLLLSFCLGYFFQKMWKSEPSANEKINSSDKLTLKNQDQMKLGAFSISLSVKDIKVSKAFYENLGFTVLGGDIAKNYLILKNENSLIGLFQGMFEGNILTFSPGWDENGQPTPDFDDVREIQRQLKAKNIKLESEADEKTSGPASLMVTDPDGNMILIDQHR